MFIHNKCYFNNTNFNKFKSFDVKDIEALKDMGLSPNHAVFYFGGSDYLDDRDINWAEAYYIMKSFLK